MKKIVKVLFATSALALALGLGFGAAKVSKVAEQPAVEKPMADPPVGG